jgi:hypothetical protein
MNRARLFRSGYLIGSPTLFLIIAFVGALYMTPHIPRNDDRGGLQSPLPGFPKSKTAEILNRSVETAANMGVGPNLYATAVVFAENATNMLGPDGQFQTELTRDELATTLDVTPETISTPDGQINPDAVLFRARSATLTASAIIRSLEMRTKQLANPTVPWAVYAEWNTRDFALTLNKLRNPNDEERAILTAICQAPPRGEPKPGDKIRATGMNRGLLESGPVITGGMLPFAPLTSGGVPGRLDRKRRTVKTHYQ